MDHIVTERAYQLFREAITYLEHIHPTWLQTVCGRLDELLRQHQPLTEHLCRAAQHHVGLLFGMLCCPPPYDATLVIDGKDEPTVDDMLHWLVPYRHDHNQPALRRDMQHAVYLLEDLSYHLHGHHHHDHPSSIQSPHQAFRYIDRSLQLLLPLANDDDTRTTIMQVGHLCSDLNHQLYATVVARMRHLFPHEWQDQLDVLYSQWMQIFSNNVPTTSHTHSNS